MKINTALKAADSSQTLAGWWAVFCGAVAGLTVGSWFGPIGLIVGPIFGLATWRFVGHGI